MEARLGGSYAAATTQPDVLQYKELEQRLKAEEKAKRKAEKAASTECGSTHQKGGFLGRLLRKTHSEKGHKEDDGIVR
ncbi:MAG: hypothetical protein MMC33_001890 [Icmadophila ericetorum]|nr:hypothetical protein [Icmadophila ericetorum]